MSLIYEFLVTLACLQDFQIIFFVSFFISNQDHILITEGPQSNVLFEEKTHNHNNTKKEFFIFITRAGEQHFKAFPALKLW